MSYEPFVSVIIPAYQAEAHIQNVLQSLKNQEFPQVQFEVIVIVSGNDATFNICKSFQNHMPNLLVYNCGNKISAGNARNIGVSLAKGDIFSFIDSDCIAPPHWLKLIVEDFETFLDVFGILGIYSGGKTLLSKIIGGELVAKLKKIDMFTSLIEGNCAFKRIVFAKGCKFGDLTYGEAMPLTNCMKKNNFKMLLDPELQVTHLGRFDLLKHYETGFSFYYWYLMYHSNQKQNLFKAVLKSSFVIFGLFLLGLVPFSIWFANYSLLGFPIFYFLIIPFLIVNIIFTNYIRRDFLISTVNKLKYFPYLILMRWFHQFGYVLASLKALYYVLMKK